MFDTELKAAKIDKIKEILKFIQVTEKLTVARLIETAFPSAGVQAEKFYDRPSYPLNLYNGLSTYIESLESHKQRYILEVLGLQVAKQDGGQTNPILTEGMSQLRPGDLLDRCTNEKGRYLVFNAVNRDRYSIAAMRILSGSRFGSEVPLFKTKKLFPNAKDGEVNGLLFQTGESIYAVGRVKEEYRYRVTSMSYEYRGEEDRTDLYGLRLSHNDKFKRPMAYRIYAYQIRGALRYRKVVEKLSGLRSFDDSVFDDLEISIGSDIKTKLFANHPLPNGLTVYIPDDEDEG